MTTTLDMVSVKTEWTNFQIRHGYTLIADPLNNVGRMCSLTRNGFTARMIRDGDAPCFIAEGTDPTDRLWMVMGYAGAGCYASCPRTCVKSHHRYYLLHPTADGAWASLRVPLDEMTNLY